MNRIQEMAMEATKHLDENREARDALPFEIRNAICIAYMVCIDIQFSGHDGEGELDLEEANALLDEACEAINAYVLRIQGTDRAQCEQIGEIVRPISLLSTALNHDSSL